MSLASTLHRVPIIVEKNYLLSVFHQSLTSVSSKELFLLETSLEIHLYTSFNIPVRSGCLATMSYCNSDNYYLIDCTEIPVSSTEVNPTANPTPSPDPSKENIDPHVIAGMLV